MRILLCLTIALIGCEGPTLIEIAEPEPPDVRFLSALVDYRSMGTVVETILGNDGESGVFRLTFWAKHFDGSSWIARETYPRVTSRHEEVQYYWAITRDGTHIPMDSVQAWSASTVGDVWALTDTHRFD